MKTILFLLLSVSLFGQVKPVKYRVRAVKDSVFIQDTIYPDHTLKVWSPYAKDFMLTLINPNGYVVDILQPHKNGWKRGQEMQGWYSYDLVWYDFRGKRATKSGKVFVL
jgi:hypothetical protein